MQNISSEEFRAAMRHLAGAVTVITSAGAAGQGGFTATAVCSVSDTPPTLLVCVNKNTDLHDIMIKNGNFSVNLLTHQQAHLSNRFAGFDGTRNEDRLLTIKHLTLSSGAPILTDALVSFDCLVQQVIDAHTHSVIFGTIVSTQINEEQKPLIYLNRSYGTFETNN